MNIILSQSDSRLKKKIINELNLEFSEYQYNAKLDEDTTNLLIVIDQNLSNFEEDILLKMRKSTQSIGIWSKNADRSYLPKKIHDLLDSLVCEDNLVFILKIIKETTQNIFQHPDCSEIEIKDIPRVNCRTGKKI
ncbi:hypothetical protein VXQ92_11485 [Acinetobacter sp. 228]|uniref:hypothetical protein n=1 Tax=Acinetobacter sp. 228 TaxID=3114700 RepID=UPI003A89D76E